MAVCPVCVPIWGVAITAVAGFFGVQIHYGPRTALYITAFVGGGIGAAYKGYNYFHKYEYFPRDTEEKNSLPWVNFGQNKCVTGRQVSEYFAAPEDLGAVSISAGRGSSLFLGNDQVQENFYFSLCKLKSDRISSDDLGVFECLTTTYKKVPTIYNFDDNQDKLHIFCSQNEVSKEQVHVSYNKSTNTTLIKIDIPWFRAYKIPGLYIEEAIIVDGEHQCLMGDNPSCLELGAKFSENCG